MRGRRLAIVLFLVALAARLALVFTSRFAGDEAPFWEVARGIAKGTSFPTLGPSITGGAARHPGPAFYWLMALPQLVSSAPEVTNAYVAVLGAISVVLYFHALRPFFDDAGAGLAALFMACMPWSTLYWDRIWNPNVLGFLVALAFWSACRLRRDPSSSAVALLLVACAAMPQFHLSSPVVWCALAALVVPTARGWSRRWAAVGAGLGLALYVPFAYSEIVTRGADTRAFLAETGANASFDFVRVPLWAFRLLTLDVSYHQLYGYWGVRSERELLAAVVRGTPDFPWSAWRFALVVLSVAVALAALAAALDRARRRTPVTPQAAPNGDPVATGARPFLWAATVGLAANVALLGIARKPIFGHYVHALLPFYFVAFAELGCWTKEHARFLWPIGAACALVLVGGLEAAQRISRRLDARNGLWTIRHVLAALRADRPDATGVRLDFDYRASREGYRVLSALLYGRSLSTTEGTGEYRLQVTEHDPPPGALRLLETGPVTLYKLR